MRQGSVEYFDTKVLSQRLSIKASKNKYLKEAWSWTRIFQFELILAQTVGHKQLDIKKKPLMIQQFYLRSGEIEQHRAHNPSFTLFSRIKNQSYRMILSRYPKIPIINIFIFLINQLTPNILNIIILTELINLDDLKFRSMNLQWVCIESIKRYFMIYKLLLQMTKQPGIKFWFDQFLTQNHGNGKEKKYVLATQLSGDS